MIIRFRIPLPGLGIDSVNVYLVGRGLIDTGLYSIRSFHELIRGLRGSGLRLCDVEVIVVTHFHVDHLSLLPILWDSCSVRVFMGSEDLNIIRGGATRFVEGVLEIFKSNGVPLEELSSILGSHPVFKLRDVYEVMLRDVDIKPLSEGSRVDFGGVEFRVVELPGHTPGSVGLVSGEEIFVGDVLIDGITPHVIAHSMSRDPLGDHLESLRRIANMKLKIAYPGHRDPVVNPTARALELIQFHEDRLGEILKLVRERPRTGYDVARNVKWRVKYRSWDEYPAVEKFFAIGEAIAHLVHLKERGLVDFYEENGLTFWYVKP